MKNHGIGCPSCNCLIHAVLETRKQDGSIRRRRQCQQCSEAFVTEERITHYKSDPESERAQSILLIKARARRISREVAEIGYLLYNLK